MTARGHAIPLVLIVHIDEVLPQGDFAPAVQVELEQTLCRNYTALLGQRADHELVICFDGARMPVTDTTDLHGLATTDGLVVNRGAYFRTTGLRYALVESQRSSRDISVEYNLGGALLHPTVHYVEVRPSVELTREAADAIFEYFQRYERNVNRHHDKGDSSTPDTVYLMTPVEKARGQPNNLLLTWLLFMVTAFMDWAYAWSDKHVTLPSAEVVLHGTSPGDLLRRQSVTHVSILASATRVLPPGDSLFHVALDRLQNGALTHRRWRNWLALATMYVPMVFLKQGLDLMLGYHVGFVVEDILSSLIRTTVQGMSSLGDEAEAMDPLNTQGHGIERLSLSAIVVLASLYVWYGRQLQHVAERAVPAASLTTGFVVLLIMYPFLVPVYMVMHVAMWVASFAYTSPGHRRGGVSQRARDARTVF